MACLVPRRGNAKYAAYNTQPFDEVMMCVGDLDTCTTPHHLDRPVNNAGEPAATSALAVLQCSGEQK